MGNKSHFLIVTLEIPEGNQDIEVLKQSILQFKNVKDVEPIESKGIFYDNHIISKISSIVVQELRELTVTFPDIIRKKFFHADKI